MTAPLLDGLFAIEGKAPGSGEVLATPEALAVLHAQVGDEVTVAGLGPRRIVGRFEPPSGFGEGAELLVSELTRPGSGGAPRLSGRRDRWFVGGPASRSRGSSDRTAR